MRRGTNALPGCGAAPEAAIALGNVIFDATGINGTTEVTVSPYHNDTLQRWLSASRGADSSRHTSSLPAAVRSPASAAVDL
jgi:hypothetical protein